MEKVFFRKPALIQHMKQAPKQNNDSLAETYVLVEITNENIAKIHEMCERNRDYYPVPLGYFIRGTLGDSGYIPELCVAIFEKSDEKHERPIGYFHLTKRKGWVMGTRVYVKSFMIDTPYRRKGIGTWALREMMKRAKKRFPRSTIHFGACNPDYWFPGVDTRHTAALFFLYKMGFKKHGIIQSLTVHLEQFKDWNPITERNGYTFRRATPEDLPALKAFVKKNFFGTWHLEAEHSFKNNPPTTFIALDPNKSIVGFSSHSVEFPSAFGPIGINKAIRGQRLGDILLRWCMWDIMNMGHSTAIIMWVVGDVPKFYSKTIGAYIHPIYYSVKRWL